MVVGARPGTYPLLLPRSSARVGVYAAPEFRSAVVASDDKQTPDALFQVGGAATTLVDGIADALFAERVAVRERPSALVPATDVDLVLVPRIEAPTTYWTRTPTHVYALELKCWIRLERRSRVPGRGTQACPPSSAHTVRG